MTKLHCATVTCKILMSEVIISYYLLLGQLRFQLSNGAEIDREVKNYSIINVYFRRAPYTMLIKKGLGCL